MNIQEKEQAVAQLSERFLSTQAAFVVEYKGCTCAELTSLRKELQPSGSKFAVVKNTIAKRAVAETSAAKLADSFVGPTAVIWADHDPVAPAKVVANFAKAKEKFIVKAGVFEGKLLSPADIDSLSKLPGKQELLANLLAMINAPATRLLQTINAPASSVVRLLNAWKEKMENKS